MMKVCSNEHILSDYHVCLCLCLCSLCLFFFLCLCSVLRFLGLVGYGLSDPSLGAHDSGLGVTRRNSDDPSWVNGKGLLRCVVGILSERDLTEPLLPEPYAEVSTSSVDTLTASCEEKLIHTFKRVIVIG